MGTKFSIFYVLRKQRKHNEEEEKINKTCVLTPYKDVLIFSTFEDLKIVCVLTPYQDVVIFFTFEDIKND